MFNLSTLFVLLLSSVIVFACHTKQITILSDFSNEDDINFFKTTLPWIVDNVGNMLRIRYYFKDSDGVKECFLEQMKGDTNLQVTYLSNTAQGIPINDNIGSQINDRKLRKCLKRNPRHFTKKTNRQFFKVKSDTTPVIIVSGRKTICGNNPEHILKSICMTFGRKQPYGCLNPKEYPKESSTTLSEFTTQSDKSTEPIKESSTTTVKSTVISEATTAEITVTEAVKTTVTGTDTTGETTSTSVTTAVTAN